MRLCSIFLNHHVTTTIFENTPKCLFYVCDELESLLLSLRALILLPLPFGLGSLSFLHELVL